MSAGRIALAIALLGSTAHARPGDPFDGDTMAWQVGGGFVGTIVGAGALGLTAGAIAYAVANRSDKDITYAVLGMGMCTGGEIGLIYGVKYYGDEHDGTGSTGATILGGLIGVGTAVAIGFFGSEAKVPPPAIAILATTAVVAGPIVGYHLSSDKPSEPITLMLPLISTPF